MVFSSKDNKLLGTPKGNPSQTYKLTRARVSAVGRLLTKDKCKLEKQSDANVVKH